MIYLKLAANLSPFLPLQASTQESKRGNSKSTTSFLLTFGILGTSHGRVLNQRGGAWQDCSGGRRNTQSPRKNRRYAYWLSRLFELLSFSVSVFCSACFSVLGRICMWKIVLCGVFGWVGCVLLSFFFCIGFRFSALGWLDIEKETFSHDSARFRFTLPNVTDVLGLPTGQHMYVIHLPSGLSLAHLRQPPLTSLFLEICPHLDNLCFSMPSCSTLHSTRNGSQQRPFVSSRLDIFFLIIMSPALQSYKKSFLSAQIDGRLCSRAYTPVSDDSTKGSFEILVKVGAISLFFFFANFLVLSSE